MHRPRRTLVIFNQPQPPSELNNENVQYHAAKNPDGKSSQQSLRFAKHSGTYQITHRFAAAKALFAGIENAC